MPPADRDHRSVRSRPDCRAPYSRNLRKVARLLMQQQSSIVEIEKFPVHVLQPVDLNGAAVD